MKYIVAFIVAIVVFFTAAMAPAPAQTYVRPVSIPGINVTTDGMPTRLTFEVTPNQKRVKCVQIVTGGGKVRVVSFYSSGTFIKEIRVPANHNSPKKCETSFPITARRLTVKVQEQIWLKKWLGKGSKTLYLW